MGVLEAGEFEFCVEDHEGGHGVTDGRGVDDVSSKGAGVADEGGAVTDHDLVELRSAVFEADSRAARVAFPPAMRWVAVSSI